MTGHEAVLELLGAVLWPVGVVGAVVVILGILREMGR